MGAERAIWRVDPDDAEVAGFAREVEAEGQKLVQVRSLWHPRDVLQHHSLDRHAIAPFLVYFHSCSTIPWMGTP